MKRKILLICFLLTMVVCTGFACSKEDTEEEEPEKLETVYEENITVSEGGTYFLFSTRSGQEYVDFLEMLDQEKYAIVDMTVQGPSYHTKTFFAVTYQLREANVEESAN